MRDRDRRVLYVGRSVSLRPRVRSYWRDLGDHAHLRPMLSRVVELEPILTESEQEAAFLERNLLEHLRPRHNRTMGVESPIYLRLDTGPDDPGLELLHEPGADTPEVRHFGPHLGWSPTTIAVQALGRLHPLAYAAEGLAGSGRELGRGRGVEPAERGALGAQIAAVLERWPVPSSSRPRAGCSSSSTPWTGSPSRRRRSRSPRRTSTSSATPAASGR